MTVSCKMTQCPYHDRGFCAKPGAVNIDQMGMCSVLWRKGQQQRTLFNKSYTREKIKVIDAEVNEIRKEAGADSAIS